MLAADPKVTTQNNKYWGWYYCATGDPALNTNSSFDLHTPTSHVGSIQHGLRRCNIGDTYSFSNQCDSTSDGSSNHLKSNSQQKTNPKTSPNWQSCTSCNFSTVVVIKMFSASPLIYFQDNSIEIVSSEYTECSRSHIHINFSSKP